MTEYPPLPPSGGYPPPGGYPPSGYPVPGGYPVPPRGTNGLAIASMVCSLVSPACYGVTSIVGIILGIIALNQIKRTGEEGRGMALAGVIIGGVFVVLGIIAVIILVIVVAMDDSSSYSSY